MLRRTVLLVFAVCMVLVCSAPVSAIRHTLGMRTEPLTEEEKRASVKEIGVEVIAAEEGKAGIKSFDVSADGMIAVATESGSVSRIYVYDQNGIFQYGFRFSVKSAYAIGFEGQNIAIYCVRGDMIYVFDSSGACVSVERIVNCNADSKIAQELLSRTQKVVAGYEYRMEQDIHIFDSYSRLVKADPQGVKTILYDVTTEHIIKQVIGVLCIVGFFSFSVYGIYRKQKSKQEKHMLD